MIEIFIVVRELIGFGTKDGSQLRDKVVKELKKQGYDGMSDVAGIGGRANFG